VPMRLCRLQRGVGGVSACCFFSGEDEETESISNIQSVDTLMYRMIIIWTLELTWRWK
jgi:hypothetical protein